MPFLPGATGGVGAGAAFGASFSWAGLGAPFGVGAGAAFGASFPGAWLRGSLGAGGVAPTPGFCPFTVAPAGEAATAPAALAATTPGPLKTPGFAVAAI